MTTPTRTDRDLLAALATRFQQLMGVGTLDDMREVVHPDAVNQESVVEPPAARGRGPEAFWATAQWLRTAFSDMSFAANTVVVEGDLVVTHGLASGRHSGDFVLWSSEGTIERVFAPTGKTFSVHHAHFHRFRDGLIVEHWAVRDERSQGLQLGWVPPTPIYLIRCAAATRRARRAAS